ncbi:hypothetical protein [Nocardia sp. NPDC020380]|uniref:hypothetical protein n=1 Tax=Nocardia sp. NPDC020380 TaxID=3364309 RepID=UPI003790627A
MAAIRARHGPSVSTQVEAEANRLRKNVHASTFERYDEVHGWLPGSALAAYRDGRPPIVINGDRRPLEPGVTSLNISLDQLLPLLNAHHALRSATVTQWADAVDGIGKAIGALVAPFATDLLEQNRGQQPHPLIELAFGEALAEPVSPDDPDREEKLYRRWLMGRGEELDEGTFKRFEDRFESRQGKR